MSQNSNQFALTAEKGQLTLGMNINVFSGKVTAGSAALTPATAVVLSDVTGPVKNFTKATAITDDIFGFVPYNIKTASYAAGEPVKMAFQGSVMIMEASAAIAAGADVQFDPATEKVATLTSTNTNVGKALTKAATDGDLVEVLITTPGYSVTDLAAVASLVVTNNAAIGGTLDVVGISTLVALLNADGGIAVDTNKFTVSAAGVVAIASTLDVTGITTLVALLNADGGIAIDTNKFTVSAAGVVTIASTLDVTGVSTLIGGATIGGALIQGGTGAITATTGAGAVAITGQIHEVTTTATGDALTLANGTAGQRLTLLYVAEAAGGDTAICTPTTLAGGSTITLNALGDSADIQYSATGGWYVLGLGGSAAVA